MPAYQRLPSPASLKLKHPLSSEADGFIASTRRQIAHILSGLDSRFLVIVGPCSIHCIEEAREYGQRLKELASRTPSLLLVMRVYFEKSRTSHSWKGFLYDPELNSKGDLVQGIDEVRALLIALAAIGVPTGAELLEPLAAPFFSDLLSWCCIGARTATSQIHRQLASELPIPIAFKNSLDGGIDHAIRSVAMALHPQCYFGIDNAGVLSAVSSHGNPYAHVALRGSDSGGNYDSATVASTALKLQRARLPWRFLVDCSHGNSQRYHERQGGVLHSLLDLIEQGQSSICGTIIESNLVGGSQPFPSAGRHALRWGVSITDPCLSWEDTEQLLLTAQQRLEKQCPLLLS